MNKRISFALIAMMLFSLIAIAPASAADNSESKLSIISLKTNPDTIYTEKETKVTVHVSVLNDKTGKKIKDIDSAMVMLNVSKDDKQQRLSLKSVGNGDYETKVKLSSKGTWDVSVVALNKEQIKSEKDMDTMETNWEVKTPKDNSAIWWIIGFVVLIVIILLYWILRRRKVRK